MVNKSKPLTRIQKLLRDTVQELSAYQFVDWLNENLPKTSAITSTTIYNWRNGGRPHGRTMQKLIEAYPSDDPRHQFAVEVLKEIAPFQRGGHHVPANSMPGIRDRRNDNRPEPKAE